MNNWIIKSNFIINIFLGLLKIYCEDIANVYTFHEVVDRLTKNYHNGISEEELESKVEEELSIEASHIPTREH